jgi:hypothetical protein
LSTVAKNARLYVCEYNLEHLYHAYPKRPSMALGAPVFGELPHCSSLNCHFLSGPFKRRLQHRESQCLLFFERVHFEDIVHSSFWRFWPNTMLGQGWGQLQGWAGRRGRGHSSQAGVINVVVYIIWWFDVPFENTKREVKFCLWIVLVLKYSFQYVHNLNFL